jgi:hypothetical protein
MFLSRRSTTRISIPVLIATLAFRPPEWRAVGKSVSPAPKSRLILMTMTRL